MDTCLKLFSVPLRILCILLLIIQMGILDVYLSIYINKTWLTWIIADVIIVILFIIVLVMSYIQSQREHAEPTNFEVISKAGKLPLMYIAWGLYSFILLLKILYCVEYFVPQLKEDNFWGPNVLKLAFSLSAPLFLIYLLSHVTTTIEPENRKYIDSLTSGVTFDIFDTVDILDILFIQQSKVILTPTMFKIVLGFSLVNIVMPLLPMFLVSYSHFGKIKLTTSFLNIYRILMIIFVNVPYLAIRLLLIHVYGHNMSVFLMKNFLSIFVTSYDIYEQRQLEKLKKYAAGRRTEPEGTALEQV
ncbi:Hypothetical predicted protein [Argonauta hians]